MGRSAKRHDSRWSCLQTSPVWVVIHTHHGKQREVWEDFNDSAVVIEYVDTTLGETVEGTLIKMLSPDGDGFYMVVTDSLIKQLTHKQLHTLWVAVSNKGLELPQSVDKAALNRTLGYAVGLRKLEAMAAKAMEEYHAELTEPLDPDTL